MYKTGLEAIGNNNYLTNNDWSVYAHAPGQAATINACNGGIGHSTASNDGFPTSLGPFAQNPYSGCVYQGPQTAAGSVSCPGMSTWTKCSAAPVSTTSCYNGAGYDDYTAQVECDF